MKRRTFIFIIFLSLASLAQETDVHDSLFSIAKHGNPMEKLHYLHLYQKDKPKNVKLILNQVHQQREKLDKNIQYQYFDVSLDIANWQGDFQTHDKVKDLAIQSSTSHSDELMRKYFNYKSWCITHNSDYQGIIKRSLTFNQKLTKRDPFWVKRNNYTFLSYAYYEIGEYDSALYYAQLVLKDLKEQDEFYKINLNTLLVYISSAIKDNIYIYLHLNKAIEQAEYYDLKRTLIHLYLIAGRHEHKMKEYSMAIQLFTKSLSIEHSLKTYEYHPILNISRGIVYNNMGLLDSALYAFQQARNYDKNKLHLSKILLEEVNIYTKTTME